jgi:hypothetical protein
VLSPIFAFRPARAAERLGRRNEACPLAPGELVGPAAGLGVILPVVRASAAPVARGALVAAKELHAPLGLAVPAGARDPGRWFDEVTGAADEVAAGLPIFLSGEVVVAGEGGPQLERAREQVWALLDAGVTHVALDATAIAPAQQGRVLADLAAPILERGVALDVVVELAGLVPRAARSVAIVDELRRVGVVPALVSARCPAVEDASGAREQVGLLDRLSDALRGVPLMRRGPVSEALLGELTQGRVALLDDGGAAEARAEAAIPDHLDLHAPGPRGESRVALAAEALLGDDLDRLEAWAYLETFGLLERLGLRDAATRIARSLERRLASPDRR